MGAALRHAAGSGVIKIGLIGCGGRGSGAAANAMNAGKDVRLVAMADVFADRLQGARGQLEEDRTPGRSPSTTIIASSASTPTRS